MKNSIIKHPAGSKFILLRDSYLSICLYKQNEKVKKDKTAAAVLAYFEHLTNAKIFISESSGEKNPDLRIAVSTSNIEKALLYEFSNKTIISAIKNLVKLSLIEERQLMAGSSFNKKQYLLNIELVQYAIDNSSEWLCNFTQGGYVKLHKGLCKITQGGYVKLHNNNNIINNTINNIVVVGEEQEFSEFELPTENRAQVPPLVPPPPPDPATYTVENLPPLPEVKPLIYDRAKTRLSATFFTANFDGLTAFEKSFIEYANGESTEAAKNANILLPDLPSGAIQKLYQFCADSTSARVNWLEFAALQLFMFRNKYLKPINTNESYEKKTTNFDKLQRLQQRNNENIDKWG